MTVTSEVERLQDSGKGGRWVREGGIKKHKLWEIWNDLEALGFFIVAIVNKIKGIIRFVPKFLRQMGVVMNGSGSQRKRRKTL